MRTYRLSRYSVGAKYHQYRVVLPNALCDRVWDAGIRSFTIEVTDAGILLKPGTPAVTDTQPAWLKP